MLTPKNIIYGFCKTTNPPKYKYLISLYRNEQLHVVACFPTSQNQSGAPLGQSKHGANRNSDNEIVGWFHNPKVVGVLSDKEYENLLYAMVKSDNVPKKYQILFDEVLQELGRKRCEAQ